jgi:aminopeptidase
MTDPRMSNLARILVQHSMRVQPKDRVALIANPIATPLLKEITREVLRAGGYPILNLSLEELQYVFFTEANEDQLRFLTPMESLVYEDFECFVYLWSQCNTRSLTNTDSKKRQISQQARTGLMKSYIDRTASGDLRWVGSLYPTNAYAQDTEMSLAEFEDFLFRTTFADREDPVAAWRDLQSFQERQIEYLAGKKEVRIQGSNVDLRMSIEGRTFINASGQLNMPDGEIYTSPVEDSIEGWIRFSYPSLVYGWEADGIELHFERGRVVKATAEKGQDKLLEQLEVDEGAKYVGELGIGTNENVDRFTKNMLFDEKIGGTIHLALGNGFPEAGGANQSAIHWDLLCDMRDGGTIEIDGELFYESGEFIAK